MRSTAGTSGSDGSGLPGAATLGARARDTHTVAGAEAGHGYWWRSAREAWERLGVVVHCAHLSLDQGSAGPGLGCRLERGQWRTGHGAKRAIYSRD